MFDVGARVRTCEQRKNGHTRLPSYLQRTSGRVVRVLGEFRFADEAAERGASARKEALYTVEFALTDRTVCADLFESYLEDER